MAREGVWRERGYEDFADGVFGNGGQNLYVSRAGVLQMIVVRWRRSRLRSR